MQKEPVLFTPRVSKIVSIHLANIPEPSSGTASAFKKIKRAHNRTLVTEYHIELLVCVCGGGERGTSVAWGK